MPKKAKELKPLQIRRLTKPGLHAVGGVAGLQLQVRESGARSWILRVKIGDSRRDIGLGGYPDVELAEARNQAREYRRQIREEGVDPIAARKAAKAELIAARAQELTFRDAALACYKKKAQEFKNPKHAAQWKGTIETYANPVIGALPVGEIDLRHIVRVLEPIWETKTETASRLRGRIESVLAWAKVNGYRSGDNPARWKDNLDHALPRPSKVRKVEHMRALPREEIGGFMAELRKRKGVAARALEFAILTAARSGEVRLATWDEIDVGAKLWTIPAERMKAGKAHRVPLSQSAIKLLKSLPVFEGSPYIFPGTRGGALSDMSLSKVTRSMEVDAVPHGFRSTFKDWSRSSTSYPDEVSELALAHVNSDATRSAYARDELLPKRTRLMRDWAKFCGIVQTKGDIVPIKGAKRG